MEGVPITVLWALGLFVGAVTIAAQLALGYLVCRGVVRLAARVPGPLGRGVRAWDRRNPGVLTSALCVCVLPVFLISLWYGVLGRWLYGP